MSKVLFRCEATVVFYVHAETHGRAVELADKHKLDAASEIRNRDFVVEHVSSLEKVKMDGYDESLPYGGDDSDERTCEQILADGEK